MGVPQEMFSFVFIEVYQHGIIDRWIDTEMDGWMDTWWIASVTCFSGLLLFKN